MARILIADDDQDVLYALRALLTGATHSVVEARSAVGVEAAASREDLDLALVDMNYTRDTTSGTEGLDLLSSLSRSAPALPIVVMTAWGSVEGAVEAMKRGARDYIEKPWENARLLKTIDLQLTLRKVAGQVDRLRAQAQREQARALPEWVAVSKVMDGVRKLAERVASYDANVLVTGEHGTGKDLIARFIHAASSRADKPFVPVNAGALADGVFESELFGHVKGAFTDAKTARVGCFELAHGGTLFLDEIGTMPVAQQAKLLRVLQSGEYQPVGTSQVRRCDVRVLSATNIDIARQVSRGEFREDLLYRLNAVEIHLPALRDRPEDLPALIAHFLRRASARYGRPHLRISDEAARALVAHPWPGNVRELEHALERSVLVAEHDTISTADLSLGRAAASGTAALERMTLAEAEAYLIRKAVERTANAERAAEVLGLSRSVLYRRLQALGIKVHE